MSDKAELKIINDYIYKFLVFDIVLFILSISLLVFGYMDLSHDYNNTYENKTKKEIENELRIAGEVFLSGKILISIASIYLLLFIIVVYNNWTIYILNYFLLLK